MAELDQVLHCKTNSVGIVGHDARLGRDLPGDQRASLGIEHSRDGRVMDARAPGNLLDAGRILAHSSEKNRVLPWERQPRTTPWCRRWHPVTWARGARRTQRKKACTP